MKRYNVGIIGYGAAAASHIAAINATSLAHVTSVCSSRKLEPATLASRHGCHLNCFQDIADFLSQPELHAVSICSLPQLHACHAVAAAQAGKHLILEQPIALNHEDCQAVRDAVTASNLKTCVGFRYRFSNQLRAIKAFLDRGLLGRIHYGEVDYYRGLGPWFRQYQWLQKKESGGTSLLAAGCHALDALLFFMGPDVQSASCYTTHSLNRDFARFEYPTSSVTILKFRDGRVGKVGSVLDAQQPFYFRVHLIGSEGTILDNKFYSTQLGALDKAQWSEFAVKLAEEDAPESSYQRQFETFFDALSRGEDMPLTSLKDALLTHEIVFAAERSAQRHEHGAK
ncbi:MAG: Gfo/Idh/MocA family oxidoreductase [Verrucomicrobia bacterium]|nr:Gfo/Idh/MocA family oxidoreductase [Verrucomicrobiota bacterium]